MSQGSKSKYWCFTVNNPRSVVLADYGYDDSCWPFEWDAPWREFPVKFLIWSLEMEQTLHVQGYLELDQPLRMTSLKKWPGLEGAHFEMRGKFSSQAAAIAYCEKINHEKYREKWHTHLDGPYRVGTPVQIEVGQAKKINAATLVAYIRDGWSDEKLWDAAPGMMLIHGRKTSDVRQAFNIIPQRTERPFVFMFVGAPGTGKTRTAYEIARRLGDVYTVDTARGSGLYWDGYNGQKCVILDEMDGHRMQLNFFKQLTDRYPFKVHPLGRPGVNFNSPYIFITSNTTPLNWWPKAMNLKNNYEAVMRRVFVAQFFPKYKYEFPNAFSIMMGASVALGDNLREAPDAWFYRGPNVSVPDPDPSSADAVPPTPSAEGVVLDGPVAAIHLL